MVKVCGACRFENSAAKNYCDTCGEPLKLASELPPQPPPKPEAKPPIEPPKPAPSSQPSSRIPEEPEPPSKPPAQPPVKSVEPREEEEKPSEPPAEEEESGASDASGPSDAGPMKIHDHPSIRLEIKRDKPLEPFSLNDRLAPSAQPPSKFTRPPAPSGAPKELAKTDAPAKPSEPAPSPQRPSKVGEVQGKLPEPADRPRERPSAADLELPKTSIIRIPERSKDDVDRMLRKLGIPPDSLSPAREDAPPSGAEKGAGGGGPPADIEAPQAREEPPLQRGRYGRPLPPPKKEEPPKAQIRPREPAPKEWGRPKSPEPAQGLRRKLPEHVASTLLGLVLFIITLSLYGLYYWHFKHNPRTKLVRTAVRYLGALQNGDIEAAYGLLSEASRSDCSLEDYKRLVPASGWSFDPKSVSIETMEENWAQVRYEAHAPNSPAEKDRMEFAQEGKRWLRSYDWSLLAKAEQTVDDGDYASADASARKAAAINPSNALARYYLCESAYYRQSPQEALEECRKAAELAKKYPSGIEDANLFHLHSILADVFKNMLDKPDYNEAAREYGILLAMPQASPAQRCDILLARADARTLSGDIATAARDYQDAGGACVSEDDLSYARSAMRIFSGQAGLDAVDFIQRQRMPDDQSTVLEWRESARKDLLAKFKSQGTKLKPAPDNWVPEHLGGPNYKVSVRSADVEILNAQVDIWAKKCKVNFHVQ